MVKIGSLNSLVSAPSTWINEDSTFYNDVSFCPEEDPLELSNFK